MTYGHQGNKSSENAHNDATKPAEPSTTRPRVKRLSVPEIMAKKGKSKIVVLTAYTESVARAIDPFVDIALVGDSLGMVLYGDDSTLSVSLDTMIRHGKTVVNATKQALVVVDMPFASYQASPEQAFSAAAKVMAESGCQAIKIEGGKVMAPTVAFLVERGIPVMGHVGMLPQSVNIAGGFRARGLGVGAMGDEERRIIHQDAKAIADAGVFSMVIEAISAKLATEITQNIAVPTIGIGASDQCDGQVLVTEDMAGLTRAPSPRFVKRYAELGELLAQAAADYAHEVRTGEFPSQNQFYRGKGDY